MAGVGIKKASAIAVILWVCASTGIPAGAAQSLGTRNEPSANDKRGAKSDMRPGSSATAATGPSGAQQAPDASASQSPEEAAIQSQIDSVYQSFYSAYRLGPGDLLGIYIDRHPEDSVEKVAVSPVGRVYFPLLGNVVVVGKTVPQLEEYFTTSVAEFIKEPRVTVSLLEAHSAKIGVLGDVRSPGVLIMTQPLRALDAITMAGGITDSGSSQISILRQYEDGRVQVLKVDMKKILKGKASPEENAYLRAGDTIIVHGNLFKTVGKITSLVGITTLVSFMTHGGR